MQRGVLFWQTVLEKYNICNTDTPVSVTSIVFIFYKMRAKNYKPRDAKFHRERLLVDMSGKSRRTVQAWFRRRNTDVLDVSAVNNYVLWLNEQPDKKK